MKQTGHWAPTLVWAILSGLTQANLLAGETDSKINSNHHHPEAARGHGHHDTHSSLPVGITLSTAWDSRYVSEGRDNLDGDSLFGTTIELSIREFNLGLWFANSPENSYDEFNASIEYGFEVGDFEFYAGYTHLRFMDDHAHDNEVAAGVAFNGLDCGIVPALDWYYSFDARGSFGELSVTRPFETTPWLTITPAVVFGINQGYIADGHDGANHIAARLSATAALSENIELGGYLSYSLSIDRDPGSRPEIHRSTISCMVECL